jgi:DNA-binding NtrC family response regulator
VSWDDTSNTLAAMCPREDEATELARGAPVPLADRFTVTASSGESVSLAGVGPRVLVGTSEVCALRLEDKLVSRRHLALEVTPDGLRVTDLQSTNGVFIDNVRVFDALLRGGERVLAGGTTLEIRCDVASVQPEAPAAAQSFGRMLGVSPAMRAIYPMCERLAASDVPVVIEGETGTGKEVLAEAIHEAGPRAKGPFVVFDCTMVPPNLVEAELFGHVRGAFTGAVAAREGVFEQAHGGTLLIDEIGDLDLALQPKLLRALERSEVKRLGDTKFQRVDVRILAATRRDLDREIQRGRFRDDLFHRLAVARIELPPLRARRGDVTQLARHFATLAGAPPSAIPYEQLLKWEASSWPGNVRELRNAVARFIALGDGSTRETSRPPDAHAFAEYFDKPIGVARQDLIDAFERAYVEHVLAQHGGNIERAAAASGIARRQFFRLKAKIT